MLALMDSIISSVERCATVTRRLSRFARHMEVSIQTVTSGRAGSRGAGFCGERGGVSEHRGSGEGGGGNSPFESDRGKLQQIFLNIINNAFAAMEDGGRLDITLERVDENSVSAPFADTGRGIPEEDLKRVFEPFFTTKASKGGNRSGPFHYLWPGPGIGRQHSGGEYRGQGNPIYCSFAAKT